MIPELSHIENNILKDIGLAITNIEKDKEADEYLGCNFQIQHLHIKFRKAKITPKKIGQFVTLWKRDTNSKTIPYDASDPFDFYIIATSKDHKCGFFLFPKIVLIKNKILTSTQGGKRGFRLYPNWDVPTNKLALATQKQQIPYFIDITQPTDIMLKKFKSILNSVDEGHVKYN